MLTIAMIRGLGPGSIIRASGRYPRWQGRNESEFYLVKYCGNRWRTVVYNSIGCPFGEGDTRSYLDSQVEAIQHDGRTSYEIVVAVPKQQEEIKILQ